MTKVHQGHTKSSSPDAARLIRWPSPRGLTLRAPAVAHVDDFRELLGHADFQRVGAHLFSATAHESRCSCGGTCDKCAGHAVFVEGMTALPEEEENGLLVGHRAAESAGLARWTADYLSEPSDKYVHQGAATVVCNGSGDYRVALNAFAGAPCGIEDCVRKHEESHLGELRARIRTAARTPTARRSPTERRTRPAARAMTRGYANRSATPTRGRLPARRRTSQRRRQRASPRSRTT